MTDTIQIMVTMICYMLAVIGIGFAFARRANKSTEDYFLGGRTLGPWVTAMSAEASDMSGWLLMGLPGVAYWCGVADAAWTAIGLAVGTYINWLITSKRLRRYSEKVRAITLPEFFSNRFHEGGKVIMTIAALFILIFFTVYASSCLVPAERLLTQLLRVHYEADDGEEADGQDEDGEDAVAALEVDDLEELAGGEHPDGRAEARAGKHDAGNLFALFDEPVGNDA